MNKDPMYTVQYCSNTTSSCESARLQTINNSLIKRRGTHFVYKYIHPGMNSCEQNGPFDQPVYYSHSCETMSCLSGTVLTC